MEKAGSDEIGHAETAPAGSLQVRDVNIRTMAEGAADLGQNDQLERGLKSRHIQFLALGGA